MTGEGIRKAIDDVIVRVAGVSGKFWIPRAIAIKIWSVETGFYRIET